MLQFLHIFIATLHKKQEWKILQPYIKIRVEHIASMCEACQNVQNYLVLVFGELPPRNALLLQCSEVTVDFIGLWKITMAAQAIEFRALN